MTNISGMHDHFEVAFARHQRELYRHVAVLLPGSDAAEEVFQQTCYVLLKSRDKFDPAREFLPWAYGVARNVVREYLRGRRRVPLPFSDELLEQLAEAGERLAPATDSRMAAMTHCLQRLADDQRALIERCYTGAETILAIAAQMGLTPAVLYKRLDRIRWMLLQCIEKTVAAEDHP